MSQIGNMGAPTPRRSGRLSTKASSVAGESAVTTVTNGGTRLRRKGPLTKVKARKSNAYGASGRVGAAEELSVSATGFAQAFENQRGDAFARDEDEEEEDDIDELGVETPRMSGALNGLPAQASSPPARNFSPQLPPGLSFAESEDSTPSDDDDLAISIGNTSKSFGPLHEAGMLYPQDPLNLGFSSPQSSPNLTPSLQKTAAVRRTFQERTNIITISQARTPVQAEAPTRPQLMQPPSRQPLPRIPSTQGEAIEPSVDDLLAKERTRLQREGPSQSRGQPRSQERRRHVTEPRVVDDWLGNVEPHQENESERSWRKYIVWAFWSVAGTVALIGLVSSMMASGTSMHGPKMPNLASAISARFTYTVAKVAEIIQPPSTPTEPTEAPLPADYRRDGDDFLWSRVREMNHTVKGVKATLEDLKEQLPNLLIVRRREDGQIEIPDAFWEALISKARSSNTNDPKWLEYLEQVKRTLDDVLTASTERGNTNTWPQVVTREEFVHIIETRYSEMSAVVDKKIKEAIRTQSDQLKVVMRTEARNAVMHSINLRSLAESNLVANYALHLQQPNYFSPGLGAFIDPRLTSATLIDQPRSRGTFFQRLALTSQRNPPKVALVDWKQPGDCWCSAPDGSRKGQAMLTVNLGHAMTPNQVTIEHTPMNMVPDRDISSAPREIELWVETDQPTMSYLVQPQVACQEFQPGWQCLGTFKYDIHASNHLQTFDLHSEPSQPIKKAMLRVRSNWGADHTCLYQVRLHGKYASKDHDYQVRLND